MKFSSEKGERPSPSDQVFWEILPLPVFSHVRALLTTLWPQDFREKRDERQDYTGILLRHNSTRSISVQLFAIL